MMVEARWVVHTAGTGKLTNIIYNSLRTNPAVGGGRLDCLEALTPYMQKKIAPL